MQYRRSIVITTARSVTIRLKTGENSTAVFDNIQVSEGFNESRDNFINNSSFETNTTSWTLGGNGSRVNINETGIMGDILGNYALRINGDAAVRKSVSQTITSITGSNKYLMVGGWAKADAAPSKGYLYGYPQHDNRFFGIMVEIHYAPSYPGGSPGVQYEYLPFNTAINDWQYQMFSFEVNGFINSIKVNLIYQGEGSAYFDNIQLYHDKNSSDYYYNNAGQLSQIKTANGTTTVNYSGHKITQVNMNNGITQTVHDVDGKLVEIQKSNVRTTFVYDARGNIIYHEFSDGMTQELIAKNYEFDAKNRLKKVLKDNLWYEFFYDDFGQIHSVKINDEDYLDLTYKEEVHGGKTYHTNLLKKQSYANGYTFEFEYTDQNQIKSITYNGEQTPRYEYEYDASGRVNIVKDIHNSNIYFYTYDLSGKLSKITDVNGNNIRYNYDVDGNVSGHIYTYENINQAVYYHYNETTKRYDFTRYVINGTSVTKDYVYENDTLRRLSSINLTVGSNVHKKTILYFDDTSSNPNIVKNGTASERIRAIHYSENEIGPYLAHNFTYDENGNIIHISMGIPGVGPTETHSYTYDAFNQLIRSDITLHSSIYARTTLYDYDSNGNITNIKEYNYTTNQVSGTPLTEKRYLYENESWKDQLTKIEHYVSGTLSYTQTHTYDEIGNLTSITDSRGSYYGRIYEWEGRELIAQAWYMNRVEYSYNHNGIRVSKEQSVTGEKEHTYFLDGNRVLVEKNGSDTLHYMYDHDGTLIGFNLNGASYFYITNLQGDIIRIVDVNRNVVARYHYDAWGNITYSTGTNNIHNINPYRYRGYRYDSESGLYYLQSRYYNPTIGRFINGDKITYLNDVYPAGYNLYTYANNNPVMYLDRDGNFAISIFIGSIIVGAIIGGALGGYTATQNEAEIGSQQFWIGVGTGALIGGAVGAVAGWSLAGGSALFLKGGLASIGNKLISDTASSIFYGTNNFGSWEDYAVAFIIGGVIKGSGATGIRRLLLDAGVRPALNQLTKMGTRGAEFNAGRFAYDVFTRTVTIGMGSNMQVFGLELNPSKAIIRGLFSGLGKELYG